METTLERVRMIIKDHFAVDDVFAEHSLRDDVQLDSLDDVELEMALEEEFGVSIDEGQSDKWLTVQDVVNFVDKAVADQQMQEGV